jgi:hypothetical protein
VTVSVNETVPPATHWFAEMTILVVTTRLHNTPPHLFKAPALSIVPQKFSILTNDFHPNVTQPLLCGLEHMVKAIPSRSAIAGCVRH